MMSDSTSDTQKVLKDEAEFLAGIEHNVEEAKGDLLPASSWKRSEMDEFGRLSELLIKHNRLDSELRSSLPCNRQVSFHAHRRRLLFWHRPSYVVTASVLTPLEHYASGAEGGAPPVDLAALINHIRRVTRGTKVKHLVGVCSPSGFTEEARTTRLDMPDATVVLVEPDGHGGWKTFAAGAEVDPKLLKLFDPEGAKAKLDRVREFVDERSADLLTGSLTASSVAGKVGLPEHLVRRGFEAVAASDPELRVTRKGREMMLFRGAPVVRQERSSMNVIDRIKQLFSTEGDEAEKINLLTERRATLAQQRDRIYEDIEKLEKKEAELFAQAKAATSSVPKRRLVSQLAQLRKDISRRNTSAAMLNKQMDIISTDVHNLTLIRQGEAAKLPDTEQLTEHAVKAEEMLETLKADADLVSSLETGIEESLASEEELAILAELEASEAPPAADAAADGAATESPEASGAETTSPEADEPDSGARRTEPKSRGADAEPT